ncbi:hypothetical protein HKD37_20G056491 [Glycine soja]
MYQYETIEDMQKRFTHIVNHLASLGKIFPNKDLINKVLRCLSRDLTNMSLATLFGKLQEHEMELMSLHQHEENDIKRKGITLRASSSSIQEESDKEDLTEIEEDDDFIFFVKRKSNINPKKKEEDSSLAPKFYECDQPGHMRFDCPVFKRRMEKSDKRNFKEKKAYITWEDNNINYSSDSVNKIINLGLMLKDYESGEEQS